MLSSALGATFPKHIHQTWKDHNIPEKWKKSSEACKRLNPDYKYTLWTDQDLDNFIAKEYSWFIETFRSYPYPIQRVDVARYFILHKFGGMYIDLDITCLEPFDSIIKKRFHANGLHTGSHSASWGNKLYAHVQSATSFHGIYHEALTGS